MSESVLLSEIAEQPSVLERLLAEAAPEVEAIAATVRARNIHHVVIAARGSSDNAARYAQYLFGAHNRLTVTLATPSLFTRYQTPPVMTGALVVGISQSGESPDLIAVVEEGRRQGCPTLAVTNVAGSPLTAAADHTIVLRAGKERSIAATKTYTAQLAALAMLSTAMAQRDEWRRELAQVPSFVAAAHAVNREIVLSAAAALQHAGHGVVLGRGFNFATAFEAALKAKELAYVAVEPYSSADFQHGPIALIDTGFAAVVINAAGAVSGEVEDAAPHHRRARGQPRRHLQPALVSGARGGADPDPGHAGVAVADCGDRAGAAARVPPEPPARLRSGSAAGAEEGDEDHVGTGTGR